MNREHLNPLVNFHRPCSFPTIVIDKKGKQRKKYHYNQMMTPYEKLKSLENAKQFLKKPLSFEQLDKEAYKISDNKAADKMNLAKKVSAITSRGWQNLLELFHESIGQAMAIYIHR